MNEELIEKKIMPFFKKLHILVADDHPYLMACRGFIKDLANEYDTIDEFSMDLKEAYTRSVGNLFAHEYMDAGTRLKNRK